MSLLRLWLAVAIAWAALPARAADPGDVRRKAEAVARDLEVQPKLPDESGSGADDVRDLVS